MTDALTPALAPVLTPLAAPTATAVVTAAAATALSAWGSYAIVLIVLGWMLWRTHLDRAALKDENRELRAEVRDLESKRLEDAKQLIRVTDASTALTTTRAQGDESFQTAFRDMAIQMASLRADVAKLARAPRQSAGRPARP